MRAIRIFALLLLASAAQAGTLYISTTGAATNSGSRDEDVAHLSGSAAYALTSSTNILHLDGTPDLSAVVTSGATQDTVYFSTAENSNQLIFWITAVDDTADTLTLSQSITQTTSMSSGTWTIGGRHVLSNAAIEGTPRAGDTVQFNNSPAAQAATVWTFRTAGTSAGGNVKVVGKSGTRPVLTVTGTNNGVASAVAYSWLENVEIVQQGASGVAVAFSGANGVVMNVKASDSGGASISVSGSNSAVIGCELSGSGDNGISCGASSPVMVAYCYIHDNAARGINVTLTSGMTTLLYNIFDSNVGRGISLAPSSVAAGVAYAIIIGNTVYGNNQDGLLATDGGGTGNDYYVSLYNNIFKDNGDAGTEYNINWSAGNFNLTSFGDYNIFNISGGLGGGNLNGYTANTNDLTTDPLFGSAATGDFSLQTTSPAKASGYPGVFLGGSTGYLDRGAVQRQEPSSSGGAKTMFLFD